MAWDWNIWFKNTQKYPIYQQQLQEVFDDVKSLGQTYLDVGCGKGRLMTMLTKEGKSVDGLDIHYNNFDLLKSEWSDKKYDVLVCNLVLIHFNQEELAYVQKKILERAVKYIYIFDEQRADKKCCESVDETTHKYFHDYGLHFTEGVNEIYKKESKVGNWNRQLFEIKA